MELNETAHNSFHKKKGEEQGANNMKKKTLNPNLDPFSKECATFVGQSPEDVSINHDKYLYGE